MLLPVADVRVGDHFLLFERSGFIFCSSLIRTPLCFCFNAPICSSPHRHRCCLCHTSYYLLPWLWLCFITASSPLSPLLSFLLSPLPCLASPSLSPSTLVTLTKPLPLITVCIAAVLLRNATAQRQPCAFATIQSPITIQRSQLVV